MVIPSYPLMKLALAYVPYLDHGDSLARTEAHERLMAQMHLDGVLFGDRIEAAEIARQLVRLDIDLAVFEREFTILANEQNSKIVLAELPAQST